MSLNDDAISDLPTDTLVDDDIVKSSPITQPNNNATVIIPTTNVIDSEATIIPQEKMDEIINSDVSFKTLQNGVETITQLQDVEKEFLATESIDQNSAKYLNEFIPDLLTTISLEEFTKTPSKTNYQLVTKLLKKKIALEQEEIKTNFLVFMKQSLHDVKEVLEHIKEDYLQTFLSDMYNMAKIAERVVVDVSANKNTIVPYANGEHIEFLDIAELDLLKLDFGNLQLKDTSIKQLSAYKAAIELIISNTGIKTLIVLANDAQVIQFPVTKEFMVHANEATVNLLYLAKFFNSSHLRDYVESLGPKIDDLILKLEQLKSLFDEQVDYQGVRQFLVDHSAEIGFINSQSLMISSHISNISTLGLNVQEMFIYLSKIAHPKA